MENYSLSFEDFGKQATEGNVVPLFKEINADLETPVSAYIKIAGEGPSFLLESVTGGEKIGRYSFVGAYPSRMLRSKGLQAMLQNGADTRHFTLQPGTDVLNLLEDILATVKYVPDMRLPRFCGGAVGYIGYDVVRFFEDLPQQAVDDLDLPDCIMMLVDTLLVFDHVSHKIRIVHNAHISDDIAASYREATQKIEQMASLLRAPLPTATASSLAPVMNVSSNLDKERFEEGVQRCRDYIAAGEAIQIVLSQRFEIPISSDAFDIYRALRGLNPSPYMYFLSLGELSLVGSSPEILVTVEDKLVTTRPIAGTRPRGINPSVDRQFENELQKDEKECAEHVMLVDLGRNDMGKVCEFGSVQVTEMMGIEKYSHVMHLVSEVHGELKNGYTQFDALRACFPAGTVSGAPKVRAMQIIEELEPTRRSVYAGAIGYFSYSGDMDTAITIRTILIKDHTAYIQAGAGIVADSDPEKEYNETKTKADALIRAIEITELGLR